MIGSLSDQKALISEGNMSRFAFLVVATAFVVFQLSTAASIVHEPCEVGWNHNPADDTCNKVFPRIGHRNNTGDGDAVPINYWDAESYCRGHNGWVPAIQNTTGQLRYLNTLVRYATKPGSAWWIGVHADRSVKRTGTHTLQTWMTFDHRTSGFVFRWDGSRQMPSYEGCVVMHMIGDRDHPGGNDKMITVDCEERHHVVCTKPRVPTMITAIEEKKPGRVEVLWGHEKTIHFAGAYIPHGVRVSLQTTGPADTVKPKQQTHCQNIHTLAAASEPFVLNVSTGPTFNSSELCGTPAAPGGPCYTASFVLPASWPAIRGAKYSFCFFLPRPFATPDAYQEWRNDLMPNGYVEVVQKHTEYLQDVCDRRSANVNLFYGDKRNDLNRDAVKSPWYFDSPVEAGTLP